MKKYIFILIIFTLFIGNFTYASIDISTDTDKVSIDDNVLKVKVDYIANPAQQIAQKILYTGSTKTASGTVLQAVSGSISVNSTSNPNINGTTSITITLDKTKHTVGTTFTLYLADNDGTNFTTNFTTPSSYRTPASTGNFYYTTDYDLSIYDTNINNSFFRFTSKSACEAEWKKAIDTYYLTDAGNGGRSTKQFTECFESINSIPTKSTFNVKLKPYGTFNSSEKFYYFTWRATNGEWRGSIGYKKESDCKAGETRITGGTTKIVSACALYEKPPLRPDNWDDKAVDITPNDKDLKSYDEDYKLLAPLGNISTIDKNKTLGDYLNIIFKLAIGLLIVLCVVMLVVHGIQYMGDESVFGKTEAMHSIRATIFGLLIALSSYAILNTVNPALVGGSINIKKLTFNIKINETDTSTGSLSNLCLSKTNPPNPDQAKGVTIVPNPTIVNEYIPALDALKPSVGVRLFLIAQTQTEGFFPGSLSYITKNPGNLSNTDDGNKHYFPSLEAGIKAQLNYIRIAQAGKNEGGNSYVIGGINDCALGNETYDGSLYQYFRIYATGGRTSNDYVNNIIGYFAANGKTITARTKMSEIYNMK